MEIDKIIEELNKNQNVSDIVLDRLNHTNLTNEQKDFIKAYKPEKSLIIYGSLAPDEPNHSVVTHINGKWRNGIVIGKLEVKGHGADLGYYGFRHTNPEEQEEIKAHILFSDELVLNWPMLDEFEGEGYRRIQAKYELENGETSVGYIYETTDV
jgi:gamma-glutamylcyclotransferase (GGCT)/AIG2-like uncharacterized protein YtfP